MKKKVEERKEGSEGVCGKENVERRIRKTLCEKEESKVRDSMV